MKPIKSPILNVVSQLTITMPRKKSITPSKISLLIDDPGDDKDSSKSDSDSETSSDDSLIISPPVKTPAPAPGSSQPRILGLAKSKVVSKIPLPPVPTPDWAKLTPAPTPTPKTAVRRMLNFDEAAGSSPAPGSGSSSPTPVDPASDPRIPVVDLAAETSTGARRKDAAPVVDLAAETSTGARRKDAAPAPKRKEVSATIPLSAAMKGKRKRVRRTSYSDEDTFDDDVADRTYSEITVAGVRRERDTETEYDTGSDSESESEIRERRAVATARASVSANVPKSHPSDNTGKGSVIWHYFQKRIRRGAKGEPDEQFAVCQVKVPAVTGKICGKELAQPGRATIGPRQHLKRRHPQQWAELEAIELTRKQIKSGLKRTLQDVHDVLEGKK